jgi:hypothetical protein
VDIGGSDDFGAGYINAQTITGGIFDVSELEEFPFFGCQQRRSDLMSSAVSRAAVNRLKVLRGACFTPRGNLKVGCHRGQAESTVSINVEAPSTKAWNGVFGPGAAAVIAAVKSVTVKCLNYLNGKFYLR